MIAVTNEAKAADVAAPANASLSGVAPPRPNEPTDVDEHRRCRRPGDREPDVAGRFDQPEVGDPDGDRQGRPEVHTEDARVGRAGCG